MFSFHCGFCGCSRFRLLASSIGSLRARLKMEEEVSSVRKEIGNLNKKRTLRSCLCTTAREMRWTGGGRRARPRLARSSCRLFCIGRRRRRTFCICVCVCVRIEREREKVKRVKVFIITRRVFPAQSEGTVFFVNHDFISENGSSFVIIIAGMNAYF